MNKTAAVLLLTLAFLSANATGKECGEFNLPGDITSTTYTFGDEVWLYITIWSETGIAHIAEQGCTSIDRSVVIRNGETPITNLSGLSGLTRIAGDLVIRDSDITSLDGLNNLTSVESLAIKYDNFKLSDIEGLRSLAPTVKKLTITVGTDSAVSDTHLDLSPLSNINPTLEELHLYVGDNFASVTGLDWTSRLTVVGKNLTRRPPWQSPLWSFIPGSLYLYLPLGSQPEKWLDLSNLEYVGGKLTVAAFNNQNSVQPLVELPKIESLGSSISVGSVKLSAPALTVVGREPNLISLGIGARATFSAPLLESTPGSVLIVNGSAVDMPKLASILGDLRIENNPNLQNLNGLSAITSVQSLDPPFQTLGGDLKVTDNTSLSDCSALGRLLGAPTGPPNDNVSTEILISGNAAGCNSIEQILASVPPDSADTSTAFIERFYVNILGRPSDPAGLEAWLNVINTQSASAVALGFLNSAEFKNRGLDDATFVDILYRTMFDREGDAGGVTYWLGELTSGRLREMVIWGFLRAAEFETLSDTFGVTALNAADESAYGIRAFVERFYTLVLGRQPDKGGFDNWVTALTNGSYAGGDIAKAFFLSAEYLNQNTSNDAFVETCYQAFFGRAADSAGKEGWLNVLAQGQSREYVLDGFIGSAEFVALAASYGINKTAGATEATAVGTAAERGTHKAGNAEVIPTLPMLALFIFSGLLGLFGVRRLASR